MVTVFVTQDARISGSPPNTSTSPDRESQSPQHQHWNRYRRLLPPKRDVRGGRRAQHFDALVGVPRLFVEASEQSLAGTEQDRGDRHVQLVEKASAHVLLDRRQRLDDLRDTAGTGRFRFGVRTRFASNVRAVSAPLEEDVAAEHRRRFGLKLAGLR